MEHYLREKNGKLWSAITDSGRRKIVNFKDLLTKPTQPLKTVR
jgi:hypothetical protein